MPDAIPLANVQNIGSKSADALARAGLTTLTAVDATLTATPTSTKNKDKARDPEMHSGKKGTQWYFGMKAHIGVDAESALVHTVRGTSGHVSDIAEGNSLLHSQESVAFGDAGYRGIEKHHDLQPNPRGGV